MRLAHDRPRIEHSPISEIYMTPLETLMMVFVVGGMVFFVAVLAFCSYDTKPRN